MPDDAVVALATFLSARDEPVTAVNGFSPSSERLFTIVTGSEISDPDVEIERLRLHEVTSVVPPAPLRGSLRAPRPDEAEILSGWFDAFMREADVQAGRTAGSTPAATVSAAEISQRAAAGRLWVWDVDERPCT